MDLTKSPVSNEKRVPDLLEVKFASVEKDSILSSSRTSLSFDDDERDEHDNRIPDGGWGWVVVFASLVISMIADGVSFSFGLLYIEFLKEFRASKAATSWIGSLFMAVPLLTGPIMSALVDRYGCRKMTILGGVISGIGFVMSAFVDDIRVMYVTFGFIAGLGLGLCYVTAVVSIAYWFDKKRSLATSLGACGTGVGTFVYAPLTQYSILEYGWRGTTLLLAGTFFNFCVCGCLMKDPEWWIEEQSKQQSKRTSSTASIASRCEFPDVEEIKKLLKTNDKTEYLMQDLVTSVDSSPDSPRQGKEHHRSDFNLPTFVKQNEKVPLEVLEQLKSNKRVYRVILENYPSLLKSRSVSDKNLNSPESDSLPSRTAPVRVSMKLRKAPNAIQKNEVLNNNNNSINVNRVKKVLIHQQSLPEHQMISTNRMGQTDGPWLKRKFSVPSANYYKNIKLHRNSIVYRGAMLNIKRYRLRASSCPDIFKNSMTTLAKEHEEKWYTEFVELLKDMADFSLFLELHFLMLSLSTILLFIFFIVPYFYLAEHMTKLNYTESEASIVISVIGIASTIGMVGLGYFGDKPWLNVTKTYSFCLVSCGLCTIGMFVFTSQYEALIFWSVLFGLTFASTFSFTPVILISLVPIERFTTAYGLILLCQGIGNLLGPPIGGFLFDVTQKWDQSFYQAGFWIVISGLLIAVIPWTTNRKIIGGGPVEKELAASERGSMA